MKKNKEREKTFKEVFHSNNTHNKTVRLFFVIAIVLAVFITLYIVFKSTGVWEKINSIEKVQNIVKSGGIFSFIIFMILQILQTTVLQLPAIIVTIAGTLIFGRWTAFLLSFISVMIGSILMFWIGRKAGRKFLHWLAGDSADEWIKKVSGGKYLFFLMMVFPLFPDDILCVVAGLTNMSFTFFFWTNIIARALGIGCTVFFGSGSVIPFHGWGLIVWGVIILLVALLFYLSVRYKDKIDEIMKQFFKKSYKNKQSK
ncbi:MAG: TVP38/TMEM64 family protein [Clostridiales bacterium]|nr:TVP38/TMEM64 family protein [Clostridiales bacterium]